MSTSAVLLDSVLADILTDEPALPKLRGLKSNRKKQIELYTLLISLGWVGFVKNPMAQPMVEICHIGKDIGPTYITPYSAFNYVSRLVAKMYRILPPQELTDLQATVYKVKALAEGNVLRHIAIDGEVISYKATELNANRNVLYWLAKTMLYCLPAERNQASDMEDGVQYIADAVKATLFTTLGLGALGEAAPEDATLIVSNVRAFVDNIELDAGLKGQPADELYVKKLVELLMVMYEVTSIVCESGDNISLVLEEVLTDIAEYCAKVA